MNNTENTEIFQFHCPNCNSVDLRFYELISRVWIINLRHDEKGTKITGNKIPHHTQRIEYHVVCNACKNIFYPKHNQMFVEAMEDYFFGSKTTEFKG